MSSTDIIRETDYTKMVQHVSPFIATLPLSSPWETQLEVRVNTLAYLKRKAYVKLHTDHPANSIGLYQRPCASNHHVLIIKLPTQKIYVPIISIHPLGDVDEKILRYISAHDGFVYTMNHIDKISISDVVTFIQILFADRIQEYGNVAAMIYFHLLYSVTKQYLNPSLYPYSVQFRYMIIQASIYFLTKQYNKPDKILYNTMDKLADFQMITGRLTEEQVYYIDILMRYLSNMIKDSEKVTRSAISEQERYWSYRNYKKDC